MAKCIHEIEFSACYTCQRRAARDSAPPEEEKTKTGDKGKIKRRFKKQQTFLKNLSPEQQSLFDEMLMLNVDAAHMALKYFRLRGNKRVTQKSLALKYGYSTSHASSLISALICYLDPEQKPANKNQRVALSSLNNDVINRRSNQN